MKRARLRYFWIVCFKRSTSRGFGGWRSQTEFRIRKAKEDGGGTAFADYVWKPVVLIEMKKRGQNLGRNFRQAFDYWIRLAPNRPKYVVLCNFDEFWIYDFDSAQIDTPLDVVKLTDLSERWGPLAFLFPTNEKPVFGNDHEAVTREAADRLAACFNHLVARGVERPLAQRFILQMAGVVVRGRHRAVGQELRHATCSTSASVPPTATTCWAACSSR